MRHRGWESHYCPSAYLLPSKLLFSYILQSPFLTFARTLFFSIFFPLSLCPCFHRRVFIHAASLNPPETDPSASLSLTISYLYPNIHKTFCASFKVHLPPNLSPVPTCPAPILHVNPAGASTAIGSASALCLCPFSVRDFPSCLGQGGGGTNRPGPKQDAESSKIQRTLQVNNFALHLLRTAFKQPFKLLQLLVHLKNFLRNWYAVSTVWYCQFWDLLQSFACELLCGFRFKVTTCPYQHAVNKKQYLPKVFDINRWLCIESVQLRPQQAPWLPCHHHDAIFNAHLHTWI